MCWVCLCGLGLGPSRKFVPLLSSDLLPWGQAQRVGSNPSEMEDLGCLSGPHQRVPGKVVEGLGSEVRQVSLSLFDLVKSLGLGGCVQ